MKRISLFFMFMAAYACAEQQSLSEKPFVDVSFVVIDLKYNRNQGVKICEMQKTSSSVFKGYDLFGGTTVLARQFSQVLSQYVTTLWVMAGDSQFRKSLTHAGYIGIKHAEELLQDPIFLEKGTLPVDDPYDLTQYHGIIYAKKNDFDFLKQIRKDYPGMVVMDIALQFEEDKLYWSRLFTQDERSEKIKPRWKLCKKIYLTTLANEIINDLQSDFYVIKPVNQSRGRGIIIVGKDQLQETLHLVLNDHQALKKTNDPDCLHWLYNSSDHFIVEEFISSESVMFPPRSGNYYDPTMRIPVLFLYHQKKMQIHFLNGYWKLPKKPLNGEGSINERYKSGGKLFCQVSPKVQEIVEQQLREALFPVYQRILGIEQ